MSAVPAFVFRGLATMEPHTDFGSVKYRTEADLRDALAAVWWMKGVDVRTEVDVPGCGRIDVVGDFGGRTMLVELKRSLTTPSSARKAFMQAHSYKAFREAADPDEVCGAFVTAGDFSWAAIEPPAVAFRSVEFVHFMDAESLPERFCFRPETAEFLRSVVKGRQQLVQRVLDGLRVGQIALDMHIENRALMEVAS